MLFSCSSCMCTMFVYIHTYVHVCILYVHILVVCLALANYITKLSSLARVPYHTLTVLFAAMLTRSLL